MHSKFTPRRLFTSVGLVVLLALGVACYGWLKDKKEPLLGKLTGSYLNVLRAEDEALLVKWCREKDVPIQEVAWTLVPGRVMALSYRFEKRDVYGLMLVWAESSVLNGDVMLNYEYYDLQSSVLSLESVKSCMPDVPESDKQGMMDLAKARKLTQWLKTLGVTKFLGSGSSRWSEESQIEEMKMRGEKNLSPRVIHQKMGALVPLVAAQQMYLINVKYVSEKNE